MNIVDSILRIIGIEKDSITMIRELKTIKPYIIGLAIVEYRQVCNRRFPGLIAQSQFSPEQRH